MQAAPPKKCPTTPTRNAKGVVAERRGTTQRTGGRYFNLSEGFISRRGLPSVMTTLKATILMETPQLFRATGYSGATVPIHFPKAEEKAVGPGPMEMVLLGVGGCTAIDILDILGKERETVESFRVEMEAEKAPEIPKVFTRIHMRYVLRGNIKEASMKRAIELSMEKYCSASIMLKRGGVDITTSYTIEPPTH